MKIGYKVWITINPNQTRIWGKRQDARDGLDKNGILIETELSWYQQNKLMKLFSREG